MKVIKAYRYSYIICVLLMLCQLMFCTLSQKYQNKNGRYTHLNTMTGERYVEASTNNVNDNNSRDSTVILDSNSKIDDNDIDRVLVDSEPTNTTISLDDEFAKTETNATNQSEEFQNDNNPDIASDNIPDQKPTGIPISGGTPDESNEGEVMIDIAVTSRVSLELVDTSSLMSQGQVELFLEITVGLLSFHLSRGNYMPSLFEREGLEAVLMSQSRSSSGRLYVNFRITGMVNAEDTIASNSVVAEGNLNFDQVLEKIFVEKEEEYVEALKFIDGDYFSSLNSINVEVYPETNNSSEEKDQNSGYDLSEDLQDSPLPEISQPTETVNTGSTQETNGTGGKVNLLSLGAIIGITVAAVGVLVMIAVLIYFICVKDNKIKVGGDANDSRGKSSSPHKKKAWNRLSGQNSPADSVAEETLLRSQPQPNGSTDDLESLAMYSYNRSHGSSLSIGSKIKVHSNQPNHYGSDTMSYAYSLEPGIEASVIGSVMTNDRSEFSNQESGSSIPIREIPQVRMRTTEKMGGVDGGKTSSQSEKGEHITYDHFGNTQIETAPSDLKLTQSELEMLPSNLRSSDVEGDSDELLMRKILAPAGKLGVVIDTSVEGPVVHGVNEGSQLSGQIFPGDIIIAIDEVDTRAMSASEITAVMIKTANQFRTLTVRGSS